jgi:signal transduction histidine kinase
MLSWSALTQINARRWMFLLGAIGTAAAQLANPEPLPLGINAVWIAALTAVWAMPSPQDRALNRWAAGGAAVVSVVALAYQAWLAGGMGTQIGMLLACMPILYLVVVPDDPRVAGAAAVSSVAAMFALSAWEQDPAVMRFMLVCVLVMAAFGVLGAWAYDRERRQELAREAAHHAALAELQVSEQLRERTAAVAELGLLVADVSHELRNHLVGVTANLDLLDTHLRQNPANWELKALSADAVAGADALESLLQDLGALTRPASSVRLLQLGPVVDTALRLATPALRRACRVEVQRSDAPIWVQADPGRLAQVVLNLLLNAAQAIPATHADPVVRLAVEVVDSQVRVSVQDNGTGIPPEHLKHIFETFYTTKKESGTGLGLAVAQRAVQEMGGQITVDSTVGVGSTFVMALAVQDPPIREVQATG